MAPSRPHYVDSESARNAKELGGEGSSLCGACLGQSGPPFLLPDFGRGGEVLHGAYARRLAQTLDDDRQGRDPAGTRARLASSRSAGQAWVPRTIPAEAKQFCGQVEAGVDPGAISREQAGTGESREAVAASLPPRSRKVGSPAFRKGSR